MEGMHQKALNCYQATVQMAVPLHASNIYFNMGNLFAELKQYKKALKADQKAVENNTSNYRAYTNLGIVLMKFESYDEAETALKKALKYNRRSAEAYLNLATFYSKDPARKAEAITHYKQYLTLKPDSLLREMVEGNVRKLEQEVRGQMNQLDHDRLLMIENAQQLSSSTIVSTLTAKPILKLSGCMTTSTLCDPGPTGIARNA